MTFVVTENDQTTADELQTGGVVVSLSRGIAPIVEIELEAGQGAVCTLAVVMQRDEAIAVRPSPGLSSSMRVLVNQAEQDRAGITLGTGCAGKVGIFDLDHHGGRLLCSQHALMAAGPGIMTSIYSRYRNLGGGGLDVMQLEGNGRAILRACGEVKHIRLNPGKQAMVNALAITAMSATIDLDPIDGDDGIVRLTGPGQIWLQSSTIKGHHIGT